jgi:CO/xanthine dehydrogenase FAD-binding subunit
VVAQARVAVGSCSPVAKRLNGLERELVGAGLDAVGARVEPRHLDVLSPIDDLRGTADYRRDAARTLVARALQAAARGHLQ